jgi:hypothetical protein
LADAPTPRAGRLRRSLSTPTHGAHALRCCLLEESLTAWWLVHAQSLFIGGYVLTYQLGEAPKASPKKKGGGMFSMFSKKK